MKTEWTSAYGIKTPINELDHQHLSNIIWYGKVFNSFTKLITLALMDQIDERFNGVLLPWKPLPIPFEVSTLRGMRMIDENDNIVYNGEIIGDIKHITNDITDGNAYYL